MKFYDSLWKGFLDEVIEDLIRFFIPNADDIFDFTKGFEIKDTELLQLFPDRENYEPKYVDKLVKVYLKNGTEQWIFIHIEIQGYQDEDFELRMFQYYYRIFDKYRKPVEAFALLTDDNPDFHPTQFEQKFINTGIVYTFNSYKIASQSEEELAKSDNIFAMAVLAVKTAHTVKKLNDENQQYLLWVGLVRRLLGRQLTKEKIRIMMNFLRFYIHFENQELKRKFDKEVEILTQKSNTMGIEEFLLDKAEKEGIKKGIEIGTEKGIEKGIEIGSEKTRVEEREMFVKNLLQKSTFSVEQIAEMANVSIEFVERIKQSLGA